MDDEHCYRVASGRDGRFDGMFVTAVLTTRIYCRPSCPAVTPRRPNVRFYPTPAAAQEAGFRACKRCRPDAAPGSPEWNSRADVVARAVRLIADGAVERDGVGGLAARLGYSPRQLHRLVAAEVGTGPLRLALAHRVQSARTLVETTDLAITQVAWASGFSSIRRFNELFRAVYGTSPTVLRAAARPPAPGATQPAAPGATRPAAPGATGPDTCSGVIPGQPKWVTLTARLSYRPPMDLPATLEFLGRRAVPGVEEFDGTTYRRVLRLPRGLGVASVAAGTAGGAGPYVTCRLTLEDIRDFASAVSRMRRMLDLDADPQAVAAGLAGDSLLGPLVAVAPGRRVPGAPDGAELAVRAVLGQQVSVPAARALAGRLAETYGTPLAYPVGSLRRAFPTADALAGADPTALPLPRRRATTLIGLAEALATGRSALDPGADRDREQRRLLALAGIGPWTAAYIRMRALGDPDVFPPGDLVLQRALLSRAGHAGPEGWKPWRSYAVIHLWAAAPSQPAPSQPAPSQPAPSQPAPSQPAPALTPAQVTARAPAQVRARAPERPPRPPGPRARLQQRSHPQHLPPPIEGPLDHGSRTESP